jgi:hypothetical protein
VSVAFFVHETAIVQERRFDERATMCIMEVRGGMSIQGRGEKVVVADTRVRMSMAVLLDDTAIV